MKHVMKVGMASVLALGIGLPAAAQQYRPTPEYQRQQEVYDAQRSQYEDQRAQYEGRREDYRETRRNYAEARRDYERRLAEWNRAQAIYDRRYGRGSYARMYARPVWDQNAWSSYEAPPYAGYYGRNTASSNVPCNTSNNTAAGGVIGALAGAVLGSQVASRGARTEGAVLGGVAGAVIGGAVGNANAKYKCDSRGPYFSESDTIAYREGRNRYASSYDYNYYESRRCRLAPAPVDAYGRDIRYVRVCPDDQGRYRITG